MATNLQGSPKDSGADGSDSGDDAAANQPRKRVIFGILGSILAIVLLIFGGRWYAYARVHAGTEDAMIDSDVVAITSKIGEKIDSIPVETNQYVRKGQLLVVLDNRDERHRLAQAQAAYDQALSMQTTLVQQSQGGVAQAQAGVASALASVPQAEAALAQARAQLAAAIAEVPAARANYAKAAADLSRARSLVRSGDVARQDLDSARAEEGAAAAQLATAQADVGAARDGVRAARDRVVAAKAGISGAQGDVTTAQGKLAQSSDTSQVVAAKAALDLAKLNLQNTRIYSPIDGYVGEKSAQIGQTVSAGMNLMTVIPSKDIFVTANYKETAVGAIHVGQEADIFVDAYPGHTFHGHVISINPASQNTYALIPSQNATGNFVKVTQRIPVRISIDDMTPKMPLRPGMSVEADVKVR